MVIIKLNVRGMEKILRHHLWIFSDEIKEIISDEVSGIANLFYENTFLGKGLYNGRSKNAVKVLTFEDEEINVDFFEKRFKMALLRRNNLSQFRREVNSEGDLIPGFIADRFGKIIVIQIRSLALEKLKNLILDALIRVYSPESIYERSDFESVPEDGLSRNKGLLYGKNPSVQIIEENDLKFIVDVVTGQKTGFFYDQRDSRKFAGQIASGKKALDLFTYTGGFAMNMAKCGMDVDAVDVSEEDIEVARHNAKLNDLTIKFNVKDAFNLEGLGLYDMIIADPPSLIKKKEDKPKAFELLSQLMDQITDHIDDNGRICLCSCAYNIDSDMMKKIVFNSSTKKHFIVRPLTWTNLPVDHPHLLSMPETDYLKCFWFEILKENFFKQIHQN